MKKVRPWKFLYSTMSFILKFVVVTLLVFALCHKASVDPLWD